MNKLLLLLIPIMFSCSSQFSKGITNKRELKSKKPPSMQIAEGYDNKAKSKTYKNPEKAAKAREKDIRKMKKRGDKYIKKRQKKLK